MESSASPSSIDTPAYMDYLPFLQENLDPPSLYNFSEISTPLAKVGGGVHTMECS